MSWALQDSDPRQLGGFRLRGRLAADEMGVVYLAHDAHGQSVSVAMLSAGALSDPAARDRFRAAVTKGAGMSKPPEVLASSTSGEAAAWVAVADEEGGGRAGAYLRPVMGTGMGARKGPSYTPHWTALPGREGLLGWGLGRRPQGAATEDRPDRAVVVGLLVLLVLLLVLLFLVFQLMLQARAGGELGQQPAPSQPQESMSPEPEESPSPEEPSPSPSPTSTVPQVPLDDEEIGELPTPPQGPEDLT